MRHVVVDMTTSLDGLVAGPGDGPELPRGEGGERLHQWVYDLASWRKPHGLAGGTTNRDSEVLDEALGSAGAVVVGSTIQQCLKAGLIDELQVHIAPLPLGRGIRLFDHLGSEQIELEGTTVISSPDVTHLKFRIARGGGRTPATPDPQGG
jgi:hypothetical protein